jgi:hypothetical protein
MSKVVIAYCNETWWLVEGDAHLYDMLQAKESPDLDIAIINCRVWREVVQLWKEPEEGGMPWAIHPKVIERLKARDRTTVTEAST